MNVINFPEKQRLIWASGVTNSTAREDKVKQRLPRGVFPATARCLILEQPIRPGRPHVYRTNAGISRRRVATDGTSTPNCCEFRVAGV